MGRTAGAYGPAVTTSVLPMSREERAAALRRTVETYYVGCNTADVELMCSTLTADAVHYFPHGAPQGPFVGGRVIAEGWAAAVERLGSRWTIDRLMIDADAGDHGEAVIEWTHHKTRAGGRLRGVEWCRFVADGRLAEIRAFYACPPTAPDGDYRLGGIDYEGRGYPMEPRTPW